MIAPAPELTGRTCYATIYWWEGEYDNNCVLDEAHRDVGPHYDGMTWYDDEMVEVDAPDDEKAYVAEFVSDEAYKKSHPRE